MKFELIEVTPAGEKVLGRYDSRERAQGWLNFLEGMWRRMKLSHGELKIREVNG